MRIKMALRFSPQPEWLPCQCSFPKGVERRVHSSKSRDGFSTSVGNTQRGASTLVLALFAGAIFVTAIVGLVFGHKFGYQRGIHAMDTEAKQAVINSEETSKELEELRRSNKIATNQVDTAKQELAISLENLDDLRDKQQDLTVQNRQITQVNDLYADFISEAGGMPLQVLGAKMEPLPENAFEYGFDVGMLSADASYKNLNATLELLNDDDFVEISLNSEAERIKGIVRLRGRFVMPSGFTPLQMKLSLQADDQEVEQLYDWKLGDRVDSMPLALSDLPEIDESPIEP
ncbi:hypothetical protein [Psychrobacter sp.]|uniref:hypothetical protein n=1 Tax=Psychrobacter sp. TaxID=56811 RepID=UPI0026484A16|nr:hypothetical protein [Psychrobacter sp.]MDN6275158.1 hypothetical protein [Psychrobacter sp.]MDN6308174.1 hypothetical protein [Psychrobacter sp.]